MSEHRCGHNSDIDENDNLWVDGTDLRKGTVLLSWYCTFIEYFVFTIVYDVSLK